MTALITAAAPGSNHHGLAAPAVIVADADLPVRNDSHATNNYINSHGCADLALTEISSDPSHPRTCDADPRQFSNDTTTGDNRLQKGVFDPHATTDASQQPKQKYSEQQRQLSTNGLSEPRAITPTPAAQTTSTRSRKPSPGLAARLKALGFGGGRKASSSPPAVQHEPIGRLPEEQLRKLDQGHHASSTSAVIERRGRPWKGPIIRIPSRSSLKSDKSQGKAVTDEPAFEVSSAEDDKPELLPEIVTTEPLEMDTNKYRLPEHTNGNGVKAQLGTKEEHIARDTRPPQTPDLPPPPLPKDTPPLASRPFQPTTPTAHEPFNPDTAPFRNPLGLHRPPSIYTLSRASFANQLAQLTSIQLPDAASLSSKVSAIPTAQQATAALISAAEQIRGWIYKASEVIDGLESDDDVAWAAAGGREGVEEVENAIVRFEELIKVYVGAIEELQARNDIQRVSADDLRRAVAQMEAILEAWAKMRKTLNSVKAQVEIAMEWEELLNMVLGDIENEMDELSQRVFEMEERRHRSIPGVTPAETSDHWDLDTIAEETAPASSRLSVANNRFNLPPFPASPTSPTPVGTGISQDDSSLLALFARMQPLRASLDFLPMRLSVFEARADSIFPTACEDLETKRSELDARYKKLEKDAESLRKELGEDRWVLVFRNAGRQAQKMYESVERSTTSLREAIDSGLHLTGPSATSKKMESYEARKTHYGEAIERLLSIIDKGVKDRFTINGEISRLHTEMQAKWSDLKVRMAELDVVLEEVQSSRKGQQLRDSVSSMLSNDRSTIDSGHETPQSSPPSSVIMSNMGLNSATKPRSTSGGSQLPKPNSRRLSSLPAPSNQITRKPVAARTSTLSIPSREGSATPTGNRLPRPTSALSNRPKWNASTNTSDVDTGHNFKPLTLTTPSPYAKKTPTPVRSASALTPSSVSKLPTYRSPLARASSESPIPDDTLPNRASRLSFRERLASPGPFSQQGPLKPRLATQPSTTSSRRASFHPPRPLEESPDTTPRPASSLAAASRRTSLLPQLKSQTSVTGRESPQALAGARFAMRNGSSSASDTKSKDNRPRWRG
ncbi:cortical protein KAR9-domain-containing protein [Podospora australis]|uniref:Cortical protein KAR9-domain-containing protein n=1 Tax=Podospora australis TaxID=1536484 RepID=A0AAN6WTS8_9PEZI|nr:cortical protein KAR9-domain-containing protein [Podospora australis]